MKVTESSTYRLMQTNLDRITNDLNTLRTQGSTGLKLNKPSDDPGAVRPVLTTRSQIQQSERYVETMGQASDEMAVTDSHMAHVENILVRVKEISINSINSALSDTDRATLADEIAELKNELLATANASVDGKYIFGGYQESSPPFTKNESYDPDLYDVDNLATWPYQYNGDHNPTQLEIAPGELIETNVTGLELFMGISNENAAGGYTPPYQGSTNIDLFTVLTRAEEAIRAGNVDNIDGAGGSIQKQIENLEIAANQNRSHRSTLGVRAQRVESAIEHQEDAQVDLQATLSRYQDADIIQVFNDITQKESAFEAALNITARVSQISILDYL